MNTLMKGWRTALAVGLLGMQGCNGCKNPTQSDDAGPASGEGASGGVATSAAFQRPDGGGAVGSSGGRGSSHAAGSSGGASGSSGPVTQCGSVEMCGDGLDNNCNGTADENCDCALGHTQSCFVGDPALAGVGQCHRGTQTCVQEGENTAWGACVGAGAPSPSHCGSGVDYTCTGNPDFGCVCVTGHTQVCYGGPAGTAGVGACHAGSEVCVAGDAGPEWGPCHGEVVPGAADLCDGQDENCDGVPNTGCACTLGVPQECYTGPAGTAGVGSCKAGMQACVASDAGGTHWGPCVGEQTPQGAQRCDGSDVMCTNLPGAGCACPPGETRPCYSGAAGTQNVGVCHGGHQTCAVVNGAYGWSTQCAGEVVPTAEACGNTLDENCDGNLDDGCAGLQCPADMTINAGDLANLTATGGGLSGYTWSIDTQPVGAGQSAVWTPAPPVGATVSFRPYIVGVYTLRVTAHNAAGASQSCTVNVTAQAHGLRIELSWDGTGDVDLHLHDRSGSPWFSGADCYYGNCVFAPMAWGAKLDVDNVIALGPENININNPAVGVDYQLGVHNYARAQGRVATVKVYCGLTAGVTPNQTYTSRALVGTAGGNCTANDFWRVAKIRFDSPGSCTFTPINTYTPSNNACTNL